VAIPVGGIAGGKAGGMVGGFAGTMPRSAGEGIPPMPTTGPAVGVAAGNAGAATTAAAGAGEPAAEKAAAIGSLLSELTGKFEVSVISPKPANAEPKADASASPSSLAACLIMVEAPGVPRTAGAAPRFSWSFGVGANSFLSESDIRMPSGNGPRSARCSPKLAHRIHAPDEGGMNQLA